MRTYPTLTPLSKAVKVRKGAITEVPAKYQEEYGCVAFQFVYLTYYYFTVKLEDRFDTTILADGTQFIVNGNGFIKDYTQIN